MDIKLKTGNKIVDKVGEMNLKGNIIPEAWYHTITNKNGKPYALSILILADIVYWYRPTEHRDEINDNVTYVKRFNSDDYLQRSYDQITDKFGVSKKQARDALIALEDLGVIKRHFRNVNVCGMTLSNVMYLELNPFVLKELTYPDESGNKGVNNYVNTSLHICNDPITESESHIFENVDTYTETTSEINTEIITTSDSKIEVMEKEDVVVEELRGLLFDYELSDQDLHAIAKAADYNMDKCINAINILEEQTTQINNVTGWLIHAIRYNYRFPKKTKIRKVNSFNKFSGRKYSSEDFANLERRLLSS